MNTFDIIALVVTSIGVISFSVIFTILYRSYSLSTVNELSSGQRDIELIDEAIFENQAHVKTQKKIIKVVKQIFFYLAIVIIIPIFAFALVSKFNSGIAMIGGKGIIVVASGSMSEKNKANDYLITNNLTNQFNTYDIIVLEDVSNRTLQKYDVIAFVDDDGTNIIHRIIGFTADGKYITRGDSNNADDSFNPGKENVLGRYTGKRVPYLGVFIMFFQSYAGMITLLAIVYCLIMIDRMTDKIHIAQEDRLELLASAINFENELESDGLASEMTQRIYFKGYEYTFNEEGFVDKREISDDFLKAKSEGKVIKETTNSNGEVVKEEIPIHFKKLDEDDDLIDDDNVLEPIENKPFNGDKGEEDKV